MHTRLTNRIFSVKLHFYKAVLFILGLSFAVSCSSKKKSSEVQNTKIENDTLSKAVVVKDTVLQTNKKDTVIMDTAKVKIKVQQEQYIEKNHPVAYGTGIDEYKVINKKDED